MTQTELADWVAAAIRGVRARADLSQIVLARRVGVSPERIRRLEKAGSGARAWELAEIAAACRVPLRELMPDV